MSTARLTVRLTPRGGRDRIDAIDLSDPSLPRLEVRVRAAPVEQAANDALIDILAGTLSIRRSAISIVRGATSRQKTILVEGLTPQELAARLQTFAAHLAKP